jgi:hypothetical protein
VRRRPGTCTVPCRRKGKKSMYAICLALCASISAGPPTDRDSRSTVWIRLSLACDCLRALKERQEDIDLYSAHAKQRPERAQLYESLIKRVKLSQQKNARMAMDLFRGAINEELNIIHLYIIKYTGVSFIRTGG